SPSTGFAVVGWNVATVAPSAPLEPSAPNRGISPAVTAVVHLPILWKHMTGREDWTARSWRCRRGGSGTGAAEAVQAAGRCSRGGAVQVGPERARWGPERRRWGPERRRGLAVFSSATARRCRKD